MATSTERLAARFQLMEAATAILHQDYYLMVRPPGPYDDAQAELLDEHLLIAAREFVKVHEGVETYGG